MSPASVVLLAVMGTVTTGVVTWLLAWRVSRGRVATSEASTLWAESQTLRTELRTEARELRDRVDTLTVEVRSCHAESAVLQRRLAAIEDRLRRRREQR